MGFVFPLKQVFQHEKVLSNLVPSFGFVSEQMVGWVVWGMHLVMNLYQFLSTWEDNSIPLPLPVKEEQPVWSRWYSGGGYSWTYTASAFHSHVSPDTPIWKLSKISFWSFLICYSQLDLQLFILTKMFVFVKGIVGTDVDMWAHTLLPSRSVLWNIFGLV